MPTCGNRRETEDTDEAPICRAVNVHHERQAITPGRRVRWASDYLETPLVPALAGE